MSNVKSVNIEAQVPFCWLTTFDGPLEAEDVAFVGSLLLGPSMGLDYDYRDAGYVPNDHGGQTSMYHLLIHGMEALSYPALERLVAIIEKSGGTVTAAQVTDIEAGGFTDLLADRARA